MFTHCRSLFSQRSPNASQPNFSTCVQVSRIWNARPEFVEFSNPKRGAQKLRILGVVLQSQLKSQDGIL